MRKQTFRFGDVIENGWASRDNPTRIGIFVKRDKKGITLTNGKGKFWNYTGSDEGLTKRGGVIYCGTSVSDFPPLAESDATYHHWLKDFRKDLVHCPHCREELRVEPIDAPAGSQKRYVHSCATHGKLYVTRGPGEGCGSRDVEVEARLGMETANA